MSAPEEGLKFDKDKPDWTFVQPQVIEKVLLVFAMGAGKYGRGNYQKGISYSRLFSAAMRHLWAWWKGEEKDAESGLNHLYHALWNVMAIVEFSLDEKRYAGFDDRPTSNKLLKCSSPSRKVVGGRGIDNGSKRRRKAQKAAGVHGSLSKNDQRR